MKNGFAAFLQRKEMFSYLVHSCALDIENHTIDDRSDQSHNVSPAANSEETLHAHVFNHEPGHQEPGAGCDRDPTANRVLQRRS